jgi:hypothetical protein
MESYVLQVSIQKDEKEREEMKVAEWAVKRSSCTETSRKHTGMFALVLVRELFS